MNKDIENLFKGLQALSESTFPKHCAACGKSYATFEDFVKETSSLHKKSDLKAGTDDDDKPVVQLFRNCTCGSTLMDFFSNRRDMSTNGVRKRELFGKLLDILTQKGVQESRARTELIKFINGQPSAILQRMGINAKT